MKITYQEELAMNRTQQMRKILLNLPTSCSDFIRSIAMKTSVLTRLAYTIDLSTFCEYAHNELPYFSQKEPKFWDDSDIAKLTSKNLNGYAEFLTLYFKSENEDVSPEQQRILRNHECGVMRKLSSLRSYFNYLFHEERIPGNIAELVSLPKLHQKPILHLVGSEIQALLDTVSSGESMTERQQKWHEKTQKRDYAILMVFLGTGVRVSECVGLNRSDLDLDNKAMLVTRKGGNQVILYYPDEVAEAIHAYLAERNEIEVNYEPDEDALFLSMQKKRMTQRSVEIMVKKYCAIAVPLKTKMSPHKLRSTYATRLYQETEDIYLVAEALGHANVDTTRKRYAHMSDERRKQAAENTHLPAKNTETTLQSPLETET